MGELYLGANAVTLGGRPDDFQRDASDVSQGSAAWLAAKCGKVSASNIWRLMKRTKKGWSAERLGYMNDIMAERIRGEATEHYVSLEMDWGIANESAAAAAYEFERNCDLSKCGFFDHPAIVGSGASPDRLFGEDGLTEFKCPKTKTHLETIYTNRIDIKYVYQMQWQLACTGRDWCDYVSWDSRLPENMRLYIKRVPRDNDLIAKMEHNVRHFIIDLEERLVVIDRRCHMSKAEMSAQPANEEGSEEDAA